MAIELMMFLEIITSILHNRKIRIEVEFSQEGIVLQIRTEHFKKWYESIGDVFDKGQLQHHSEWLYNFIGQVVEGGLEAIDFFSLNQRQSFKVPVMSEVPNLTTLKMHF